MYTRTVNEKRVPMKMLENHQLKNESLYAFSLGSKSSNWSAPMVEMLGFVPPAPTDKMYRAP
ncbi:hypothetical protein HKD37_10G026955 [Glycine soja]